MPRARGQGSGVGRIIHLAAAAAAARPPVARAHAQRGQSPLFALEYATAIKVQLNHNY